MRCLRVPAAIAVGFLSVLGPFGCLAASVSPADAAVNRYTVQPGAPKPAATSDRISHRRWFGYDFNAAAHLATDGSPISVNPACGAYAN